MPNYTLLLINDKLLARVDIHDRAKVTIDSIQTAAISDDVSFATHVESALAMGPKRSGKVWLFSNRFWTGTVRIPSDLHEIANADELNQAALLEAETQSGIPAFQSKVATTRIKSGLHGDPQYRVTQALITDLEEIEQAFCSSKSRWAGIAHFAHHRPTDPSENANPTELSLESEADVRNWALEAVKVLSAAVATRPCFLPPVKVLSPKSQTLLASVMGSLTVLFCVIVYARDKNTLQNIEQLSLKASKQNESVETMSRQLQKSQLSLDENRKKRQEEQTRLDTLDKEYQLKRFNQSLVRGHCANLIDAIALSADADSWLQSIESNAAKTTLQGLSLNEASAHRFASSLEQQPKLVGHMISPAQITPIEDNLIQFSIVIDLITANENLPRSQGSVP